MDALRLPLTDSALVEACAAELAEASTSAASAGAVEAARLRFAWALAHSASTPDVERALELDLQALAERRAELLARKEAYTALLRRSAACAPRATGEAEAAPAGEATSAASADAAES